MIASTPSSGIVGTPQPDNQTPVSPNPQPLAEKAPVNSRPASPTQQALPHSDRVPGVAPSALSRVLVHTKDNPISLQDAAKISDLFKQLYVSYQQCDPILREPAAIVEKVKGGDWNCFLIKSPEGELLAHAATLREGDGVYSIGRLVVNPKAQGQGLARVMTEARMLFLEQLAKTGAVQVIQSEPVTSHPLTQKLGESYGLKPTGLYLSMYSSFFQTAQARESVAILTRIMNPEIRSKRQVYIPQCYVPVCSSIYTELGCVRSSRSHNEVGTPTETPTIRVDNSDLPGFGISYISIAGNVSPLELSRVIKDQQSQKAEFIKVKIDLANPMAIEQILTVRALGGAFGGIETLPKGDNLVMQISPGLSIPAAGDLILHTPTLRQIFKDQVKIDGTNLILPEFII